MLLYSDYNFSPSCSSASSPSSIQNYFILFLILENKRLNKEVKPKQTKQTEKEEKRGELRNHEEQHGKTHPHVKIQ